MIAEDFRYLKGSESSRETIELDLVRADGMYITTCAIDVDLLLSGIESYPCNNGDYYPLIPEQRLKVLEFLKEERKKLTDSLAVKTYEGWHKSGLRKFEDYCFPGDMVDDAMVEYFINVLPPHLMRSDCRQVGAEHSYEPDETGGRHRPTYTTFYQNEEGIWLFAGYCFKGETKNRVKHSSTLEQHILKAEEELFWK